MPKRHVEYMPLAEVPDADWTPREHAERDIEDSIGRFGLSELPVLDERSGKLIGGHGRKRALLELQATAKTPPDGVEVDEEGTWLVPIVRGWSSADDDEADAMQVALNRLTERGGWDEASLARRLNELNQLDLGMAGIGYTDEELNTLLLARRVCTN